MMESFLIDLFVRSLVVLAGVAAMAFAVRRASAAVRSLVWRVGIGLLLALPAMMAILPKWTLEWLPASSEPVAAGIAAPGTPVQAFSWIVGLYSVGVVVGLIRLAASFAAASLITWRGVVVERTRRYRIVLSKEAPMPFAFGLHRPSVVLPASALDWDSAVREDVVAHEAAHVERQDWLWLLLGRIAAVLYWPNVGVTWMLHRARMDAEMAADDQVVAGGQDQVVYAEHLLRVARACRSTALLAPMAAEPPLTTRLRSLLSGDVRRNAPGRPAAHAAFIMGMLLIGPFAAMGFGPQTPVSLSPLEDVSAIAVGTVAIAQEPAPPNPPETPARIATAQELTETRTSTWVIDERRAALTPPAAIQVEEGAVVPPETQVDAVESQSAVAWSYPAPAVKTFPRQRAGASQAGG